jgi:hypothetical protein
MENQSSSNRRMRFRRFPFFPLAFAFAGGLLVMLLWNAIIPDAIPVVNRLNYFQALGLLILCRILVGGFRRPIGGPFRNYGFRGGAAWKEKMMNMTEEEKEKFREEWRKRCGRD